MRRAQFAVSKLAELIESQDLVVDFEINQGKFIAIMDDGDGGTIRDHTELRDARGFYLELAVTNLIDQHKLTAINAFKGILATERDAIHAATEPPTP